MSSKNIKVYFPHVNQFKFPSVVSFVSQNGFAKWRNNRPNNGNYQKWQKEMDRWWSPSFDWIAWRETLWDIFSNEYTKREVKERAYAELTEHFDSSSAIIKAKINALGAQLGREMAKESKTTSGQGNRWNVP